MTTQADKAREFLALHRAGQPLLLPNPWDLGSAKMLASLGFKALATTSSGFAASLGRLDGSVSREEALVHAAVMVAAASTAAGSTVLRTDIAASVGGGGDGTARYRAGGCSPAGPGDC